MLAERPEDQNNEFNNQNDGDFGLETPLSDLPLEKQFFVLQFERQVDQMSREQAQDFLKRLNRSFIVKEEMYKKLCKDDWLKFDADFKNSQAA